MLLIRGLAQALGGKRWIATDAEAGRDVSTANGNQADFKPAIVGTIEVMPGHKNSTAIANGA
jgi:hypothetical protein